MWFFSNCVAVDNYQYDYRDVERWGAEVMSDRFAMMIKASLYVAGIALVWQHSNGFVAAGVVMLLLAE